MKLNQRETIVVGVGVLVLLIMGIYFLVVEPIAAGRDKLKRKSVGLQNELAELKQLATQYKALAAGQKNLESRVRSRGSNFSPFSYLENVARETGLTGQIESMTPVAMTGDDSRAVPLDEFDVRLAGIGLNQLVRFLYKIESSDKVFFVQNLDIKPRYLTPDQLDVTIRLASPKNS